MAAGQALAVVAQSALDAIGGLVEGGVGLLRDRLDVQGDPAFQEQGAIGAVSRPLRLDRNVAGRRAGVILLDDVVDPGVDVGA